MKQCPNCQGFELYDDEVSRCPYCNTVLVPYIRNNRRGSFNTVQYTGNPVRPRESSNSETNTEDPEFEHRYGNRYIFRGIVVSISPTSCFMTNYVKLFNAIFRGQPYQIGNPVHETIIRVEEISHSKIPDQMRSLVYYGELGELDVGDDVTIRAVRGNNRLIVKDLVINDIETAVRARGVLSSAAVRMLSLIAIGVIVLFFAMIISFFTTGAAWRLLNALIGGAFNLVSMVLVTLAPILGLLFICWLFFRRH